MASTTKSLSKLNPKLIHCSISGYGQSGPYRDKPGFDTIGQALSGMMSLVTDLDDPKVAGVSFVDHSAGIFAVHGIMAALLARAKTERGQFIDVSLLQVAIAFIESHVADYLERRRSRIAGKFSQRTHLQSARLRRQTLHGSSFLP